MTANAAVLLHAHGFDNHSSSFVMVFLTSSTTPSARAQAGSCSRTHPKSGSTTRLIEEFAARRPRTPSAAIDSLPHRENQVPRHVARGLSNAQIADELFVSENTDKTHVGHVLMKLGQPDRVHLVVLDYESGLILPEPPTTRDR